VRRRRVVGRWKSASEREHRLSSRQDLADFANWEATEDGIVAFTTKYGPLTVKAAQRRRTFAFDLGEWRRAQREFKAIWDVAAHGPVPIIPPRLRFSPGDYFQYYGGQQPWTFTAETLYGLYWMELLAAHQARLRRCGRADCRRYFFADHARDKYCSLDCVKWAGRGDRRKWWREKRGRARTLTPPPSEA